MSKTIYHVTYDCDCGIDYGSCDKKEEYALVYNGSCDLATLMRKSGHRDSDGKWKYVETLTDNQIAALSRILSMKDADEPTGDTKLVEEAYLAPLDVRVDFCFAMARKRIHDEIDRRAYFLSRMHDARFFSLARKRK
jgi:hypothetical protein